MSGGLPAPRTDVPLEAQTLLDLGKQIAEMDNMAAPVEQADGGAWELCHSHFVCDGTIRGTRVRGVTHRGDWRSVAPALAASILA